MKKSYSGGADEKTTAYVETVFQPEDAILAEIRQRSDASGLPPIQVGGMDALLLEVLVRASGAVKAVEIGALGGYSGTAIARGLGSGGKLHTFELDPKHAEVTQASFAKAGVSDKTQVHVGPALRRLKDIEALGPFDLVFIDADKTGYPAYLAWAAENLRIGGVLLADNTFAGGDIAEGKSETAVATRAFNAELAQSGRFRATLIPTGEGLSFGVKVR
jgi:caffeoyl-CoA O-methyltransferase